VIRVQLAVAASGQPKQPSRVTASYMPPSRCCSECARADAPGTVITSLADGGVSVTRAPYAEKVIVPLSLMRRISGLLEIET